MASHNGKSGKCSNFGNCSLADARTSVEVPIGLDFVCTECGKPLLPTDAAQETGRTKKPLLMALVLAFLLILAWFAWQALRSPATPPPTVSVTPAPAPAPATAPAAVAKPEQAPLSGHCSAADERIGLCKTAR